MSHWDEQTEGNEVKTLRKPPQRAERRRRRRFPRRHQHPSGGLVEVVDIWRGSTSPWGCRVIMKVVAGDINVFRRGCWRGLKLIPGLLGEASGVLEWISVFTDRNVGCCIYNIRSGLKGAVIRQSRRLSQFGREKGVSAKYTVVSSNYTEPVGILNGWLIVSSKYPELGN